MNEEWFIDGYNVIHGLTPRPSGKKSAASRKIVLSSFLSQLADFAAEAPRKVCVVLDGVGDQDEFRAYRTRFLDVVYSGTVSADTFIERSLYGARGKCVLFVVTRDRAIARIAGGFGACVVSPADFADRLREGRKEREGILFREEVKAHGFNRPFEEKLKTTKPA